MKKVFLFAATAAMLTACTDELETVSNDQAGKGGLSFEAVNGETRGELVESEDGASYPFFWYAEQDRINVYADNVDLNGSTIDNEAMGPVAEYKATVSQANGLFTSVNDANLYTTHFGAKYNVINVVAAYNATASAFEYSNGPKIDGTQYKVVKDATLTTYANQWQNVAYNVPTAPMYAMTTAAPEKSYNSFGESVKLGLKRVFPVIRVSSVENNDKYNKYLGKLLEVDLVTDATVKIEGVDKLLNTKIGSTTDVDYKISATKGGVAADKLGNRNYVWCGFSNPTEWNHNDKIYMNILPVTATYQDGGKDIPTEYGYKIYYYYGDAQLIQEGKTKNNWNKENAVYKMKAFDIAATYPYIVTNSGKLLVFSGNFSDVYAKNSDGTIDYANIAWNGGTVAVNSIQAIMSEVELTAAEQGKLQNFTTATSINLQAQTSIVKDAFKTIANTVTELILPKVTSWKDVNAFKALENLELNSYTFAVAGEYEVANLFFNNDVKSTLKTVNLESVTSLAPMFGYNRNILFTNYAALETVTLNAAGTVLSQNEFAGCTALKDVNGVVNLKTADAISAFNGCTALKTGENKGVVKLANGYVAESAFEASTITGIGVAPTQINKNAFKDATALEVMDLKQAATIEAGAFNGATAFVGNDKGQKVVTLIVSMVKEDAFNGTAVVRFQLKNATATEAGSLASTALEQIKFRKTPADYKVGTITIKAIAAGTVATPSATDIFVKSIADKSFFTGYRTVTEENVDWAD